MKKFGLVAGVATAALLANAATAQDADVEHGANLWPPTRLFTGGPVTPAGAAPQSKRSTLVMKSPERRPATPRPLA